MIWIEACPSWRLTYLMLSPCEMSKRGERMPQSVQSDARKFGALDERHEDPLRQVIGIQCCALG